MPKYQAVKRIEDRGQDRKKIVIEAGTVIELTKAEAKKLGDAVVPVTAGYVKSGKADGSDEGGEGGKGGDGGDGGAK